jgi:hypothetical protein
MIIRVSAEAGARKILFGKMEDVKLTLRKLKPFIGKKADGLWIRYTSSDYRERQEWLTVINLLKDKYNIDNIEEDIVLPPPDKNLARGDIVIGDIRYLDQSPYEMGIKLPELTRHVGIFGSTGTGKTTLSKKILKELIKINIPFIVFDWERNYRDLLKEFPKVKIFTIGSDISPFFFNYLKVPEGLSYKDYVKNVIEVFNRAYIGGVGSDSVLLKVFDQAYQERHVPTTEDARKILSKGMSGKRLRGREMLWKQSSLRMLEFLSYGGTGKVYNVEDFYPIEKLQKDFVVFELGALSSSNDKRFFIEMFTLYYWLHKEHQGAEDENLKHVMVFEEFHNIVENSERDDLIQKIFRQIRKYGTGLVIIDQTPSLIPNPVFENLHTKITFSLNHMRNVHAVSKAMSMTNDGSRFIGMLKTGQAICRLMGRYQYPFLIEVPFTRKETNIPDNEIQEHMRDFYKDYTLSSPHLAEREPLRFPTSRFTPSPLERIFLEDLLNHPLEGADKRAKKLGLIPRDASNIQKNLVENGVIKPVVVERKKLFEMTKNGLNILNKIGIKVIQTGNQGLEHQYFLEQIRQVFLKNGWFTYKEKDGIDLVFEKDDRVIALELETGRNNKNQTIKNIHKLIKYNADQKFIIATNQVALNRTRVILSNLKLPDKDSIQISLARDFLKSLPFNSYSHRKKNRAVNN